MKKLFAIFNMILFFIVGISMGQVINVLIPEGLPDMDIPTEMNSDSLAVMSGEWISVRSEEGENEFLLQSAPSMFFSNGKNIKKCFCSILPRGIIAGKFELEKSEKHESLFSFEEEGGDKLKLLESGTAVFVYNFGMQLPADVPEKYRRSCYIHPVYDLKGNPLTDDFPKDHYHHRGLSWMWPRVTIAGEEYDLWHIEGVRQHFENWLVQEVGPICATLGIKNAWHLDDRKVVDEWVLVRTFRASENGRVIDVCLTWQALEPVQLLGAIKKGYGGLCFRFAPRKETIITTSGGVQEEDSNLLQFPWADESGKFGDSEQVTGVAIFQHPDNPESPDGWCLRHYGFLGVCWPGLEPVTLEPNNPVTLRYRIWVHEGDANVARVEDAFAVFVQPPTLQFIE